MRQLDASNVVRLEWNISMSSNLANHAALDDGNVLNLASISECN